MRTAKFDLLIVGAGPAGLSAAVTAARHGLEVAVVDEQHQIGGQIFRRPRGLHQRTFTPPAGYRWGSRLLKAAASQPITWFLGHSALAITPGDEFSRLEISTSGRTLTLRARRLLLATGAMDQPVPIPGWTLPGVMTAGGAQTLLKAQHLLLSQTVVLAGAHPLIFLLADQLRGAGARVQVAFAPVSLTLRALLKALRAAPWRLPLLASSFLAVLRSVFKGVRIHRNTVPTRITGSTHVTAVTLVRVDRAWRPLRNIRTIDANAVVLGFGFQPVTDLARQAGCDLTWDSRAGGWVVVRDRSGRTSVDGILVAGEPAGVGGADLARAQGLQAGLCAVGDVLGPGAVNAHEIRQADRRTARAALFAEAVQDLFAPQRSALLDLATDDTLICRCESVTRGAIVRTLTDSPGPVDINALKRQCRVGMGMCQGRNCEISTMELIRTHYDMTPSCAGRFSSQFPVKPVPLSDLANRDDE